MGSVWPVRKGSGRPRTVLGLGRTFSNLSGLPMPHDVMVSLGGFLFGKRVPPETRPDRFMDRGSKVSEQAKGQFSDRVNW